MQPTTKNQRGFWGNDRNLVCSMFIFYGLCILGAIIATIWGLDRHSRTISANATSTAFAMATEQAHVTATAVARRTAQANYELVDRFDSNKNVWRQGTENNEYWNGSTLVNDGVYLWKVKQTKKTFISWADFSKDDKIGDFDVYVDVKMLDAAPGDVCSGLIFRMSPQGWDQGGYYYALCNDSSAKISYHTEKEGWEDIKALSYYSYSKEWNRLEISARGSHFIFRIDGKMLYEMDDDRQKIGGLALVVELNQKNPARIVFDNFGFQGR
jgi:3-keto-disaccharide hydrolase